MSALLGSGKRCIGIECRCVGGGDLTARLGVHFSSHHHQQHRHYLLQQQNSEWLDSLALAYPCLAVKMSVVVVVVVVIVVVMLCSIFCVLAVVTD